MINKCMCGICDYMFECVYEGEYETCCINNELWKKMNVELIIQSISRNKVKEYNHEKGCYK